MTLKISMLFSTFLLISTFEIDWNHFVQIGINLEFHMLCSLLLCVIKNQINDIYCCISHSKTFDINQKSQNTHSAEVSRTAVSLALSFALRVHPLEKVSCTPGYMACGHSSSAIIFARPKPTAKHQKHIHIRSTAQQSPAIRARIK